jgi:hypothetical protein
MDAWLQTHRLRSDFWGYGGRGTFFVVPVSLTVTVTVSALTRHTPPRNIVRPGARLVRLTCSRIPLPSYQPHLSHNQHTSPLISCGYVEAANIQFTVYERPLLGTTTVTVVPCPGEPANVMVPPNGRMRSRIPISPSADGWSISPRSKPIPLS